MIAQTHPKAQPSIQQLVPLFQTVLSPQSMRSWLKTSEKRFYERLFSPWVLIWCLIFQRLNHDHSCDAVVSYVGSGAIDDLDDRHQQAVSQRIKSESTAGFCKARKRLPLQILQAAMLQTAQHVQQCLGEKALWLGHSVVLLDGTTIQFHPETELIQHYGQHSNQFGPCYWGEMRAVAAFCLYTGALLTVKDGSFHQSEQTLAKDVLEILPPNNICVGDSNFGVFSVAQAARHYGQLGLFRLTARRAKALAKHKMQPGEDIPLQWMPSKDDQVDLNMSTTPIVGRLLYVRLERHGFRPVDLYFFTTLEDTSRYPAAELVVLYGQRWHVELNLLYVKATLDMGLLAGKSVDVVRKELCAGMLAYNLIRAFMTLTAQTLSLSPLALSFTKCWRRIRDALVTLVSTKTKLPIVSERQHLIRRLSKCKLPVRQRFRIEPRAVRARPNAYIFLKGPRAEARQRLIEKLNQPVKS